MVSVAVRVAVFAFAVVLRLCLGCFWFVLCVGEHQVCVVSSVLWWWEQENDKKYQ